MWIFFFNNHCKYIFSSFLAFFIVRIQCILLRTCKLCVNKLFRLLGRLPVNSREVFGESKIIGRFSPVCGLAHLCCSRVKCNLKR